MIHGGGRHDSLSFVARKGGLFDPDHFPFLEGRTSEGKTEIPMVSDATVWKILQNLMMLNGERLSYRTLDVEQIGSVYEAIMGFQIELTTGRSIAVRSKKRTGAAVIVDLDGLLRENGSKRAKALRDATEQKLTGKAEIALRDAMEPTDIEATLDSKIDRDATPNILPRGIQILQPTSERRRSGSHYTPRTLTEPIVTGALQPIFKRLGRTPKPRDILELKILDPATGSGAFLVEACRQLAAKLVEAWDIHGGPSDTPVDEDRLLHALRLVAEFCLYGVDKNPMAIDLARLSLWLATFAKDREFTFIDHALRPGDSLVGLTRRQIEGFHWKADVPLFQMGLETTQVREHVNKISELRQSIREIVDEASEQELRGLLEKAERELQSVRRFADLVLAAFFEGKKKTEREQKRDIYANLLIQQRGDNGDLSLENIKLPLEPFHWEIEFPEVFERENPGFDAIIGNPPFAGKNTIAKANVAGYIDWLKQMHIESHGNADLVAHFFRRAFNFLRKEGTLGLIATNTIAQGDTRSTGLRWICQNNGTIYGARRRIKWPGEAAVVVSFVHIVKGAHKGLRKLDDQEVETISAFLFHKGGHDDPERLIANVGKSFVGSYPLGMGFTFNDMDSKGIATPISEMRRLIEKDPRNQEVIFPYIGGAEVNNSPVHAHHRYIIYFGERDEEESWERYPELMAIVEQRVRPDRVKLTKNAIGRKRARFWWHYGASAKDLYRNITGLDRVLVIPQTSNVQAIIFLPPEMIFDQTLIVFPFTEYAAFAVLQSQFHQRWSAFFGPTMKDDLRYTPSDCFETFPFPKNWERHMDLEDVGKDYYEFRAALMVHNNEGLTKTYNRFHNPEERDIEIAKLRELHVAMDRAVLDAYGWCDIPTDCEFLLDYEIDEEEWGRRKKPWRYRWPDEVRDEVLARLLALNAERAREERLAGYDG